MAKLNIVFGAVTRPLRQGVGKVKSMIGGVGSMLIGGLSTGLGMVAAGMTKIVMAGAKMEQTRVNFEVLLGSAEKAASTIKQLRSFANITPFDTNAVIEASRGLIATGSAGKVLGKEMRMVGDIASGTGRKIGDIASIYAKMKRLGRLTFEEINQLANSGALTMDELHKATGKSAGSFRRFVESGRADFSIIKKLFEESTAEGGRFYNMTEKLSQTLSGRFSTVVGKVQNALADMGQGTTGPMIRVVDALERGVVALSKWELLFKAIANAAETAAFAAEIISGNSPTEAVAGGFARTAIGGNDDASKVGRAVLTDVMGKFLKDKMSKAITPGNLFSAGGLSGVIAANMGGSSDTMGKSAESTAMDRQEITDILAQAISSLHNQPLYPGSQ